MNNSENLVWTLLQWICRNNEDEQDAILQYTFLLNYMNTNKAMLSEIIGQQAFTHIESIVREHVSDEQQHSQQLSQIYTQLSGIPVSTD